jgi:AP-1 complex subunit beta-1
MDFYNKSLQPLSGFAIQLNKNSFGLLPATPLQVAPVINANQSASASLALNNNGPTMKMQPLTNLQVQLFFVFLN